MSNFTLNPNAAAELRQALAPAVAKAATAMRDEARAMMRREGGGRQYAGLPNPSSAPGRPPVDQSGDLAESLEVVERAPQLDQVRASVSSNLYRPLLMWLERGTASMAPRPLMMPAAQAAKPQILQAFEGALAGVGGAPGVGGGVA